jgi:hypothetical protein
MRQPIFAMYALGAVTLIVFVSQPLPTIPGAVYLIQPFSKNSNSGLFAVRILSAIHIISFMSKMSNFGGLNLSLLDGLRAKGFFPKRKNLSPRALSQGSGLPFPRYFCQYYLSI